jgi:nucleoside-diphosphate-sugar epimerase
VEDAAEGWIRCGFLSKKIDSPINLATGRLHSVREFVETAARILHIPEDRLQFGKLPFRKEEMDHEGVSTDRLNELLKWVPPTSIESGIGKTIEFLESLPE